MVTAWLLKKSADRLAREVARLVEMRTIDARSAASDAMLDYMRIGAIDGPKSVPEWCESHDATDKLVAYLLTVRRYNTREWFAGIVDEVNAWAEATGERDRVELCGDGLRVVKESEAV